MVAGAGLGTVARAAAEVACLGGVAQLDGEVKVVFFPSRKSCHTHTHISRISRGNLAARFVLPLEIRVWAN